MATYEGITLATVLELTFERGYYGATKGAAWRALFYDRASAMFYTGIGDDAFEALAWALDDYYAMHVRGRGPRMARNESDRPGRDVVWPSAVPWTPTADRRTASTAEGASPSARTMPAAARRAAAKRQARSKE